jgi:CRP-like cAMP-binding protein
VEVLAAPTEGGAPQRVAMLGPREFFGEMSLLAGDRRTATVRAVEDTRIVIIDKEAFAAAIHENPEVAAEMASIYYTRSEQLAALNEQAREAGASTPAETGEKALLRRIQRFFGL